MTATAISAIIMVNLKNRQINSDSNVCLCICMRVFFVMFLFTLRLNCAYFWWLSVHWLNHWLYFIYLIFFYSSHLLHFGYFMRLYRSIIQYTLYHTYVTKSSLFTYIQAQKIHLAIGIGIDYVNGNQ